VKLFEIATGVTVGVVAVVVVAACTASAPSGESTNDPALITPPNPITLQQTGRPLTQDGVDVLVDVLGPQKSSIGQKLVCSAVTLTNHNDADADYNLLYWHVEYPDSTRDNPALGAKDALTSGTLTQAQTVKGNVCFPDKGLKGETNIVLDKPWGGDEPLTWSQVV
jgi:hypothetical protein